jgi:single-strand DNA-binding protein
MMTITTNGRITKDFELKTSEKSGCLFANFSLAVNEGFGDIQKTTFFDCIVFGADAERLIKAKAKKGSLVQVTGKFGTTEFTRRSGEPGYSLTITVLAWSYIPGTGGHKDANGTNGNSDADGNDTQVPDQNTEEQQPDEDGYVAINLDDDDLPF